MTAPPHGPGAVASDAAAEARAVRRRPAQAGDDQILQVLRLVEGLAERGQADALLDPVRDRLRVLRPARTMRLGRLLFLPVDRLIVAAKDWRGGGPLIPRTALRPLADVMRAELGAAAEVLEPVIASTCLTDTAALARIGAAIWPRAAEALRAGAMPPAWAAQGLPAVEFAPLQAAISFLLASEVRLADLQAPAMDRELLERELTQLLDEARRRGVRCWGMLLAILLQRFAGALAPFRAATTRTLDRAQTEAAEAALAIATDWVRTGAAARDAADPAHAADELARQIELLELLAAEGPRRRQAIELRTFLQAGCAARFSAGLADCIADRLSAPSDPATVAVMERDARGLRRLELEARRLGSTAGYDTALREAAACVLQATHIDRADRIRLVEILAGATAAMQAHRAMAG